jgi:hypothetical protein
MFDIERQDDPSPNEIVEKCREIQAGWTEEERINRMRADRRPSNWAELESEPSSFE